MNYCTWKKASSYASGKAARIRTGALFLLLTAVQCGPTPEKFIEKSQAALAREDYEAALLYMKNAYELSLPKEFFITKRDLSFSFLRA